MTGPGVLERAFALLGAFTPDRPRLGLVALQRRSGLPLTTVHRLAGQLVALGALEHDADGYRVGVRLWELGALAPRTHGLRQAALPFLEDLYEATHENVQLVVLDGLEALYVERLSGRGAVPLVGRAGGRLPLHASSGGLVLLAHAGPELLDAVLAAGLAAVTQHTVTTEHRLRSVLADVRRDGVVVCDRHLDPASVAVAAPVRDGAGEVVAAVSVVVPAEDPALPAAALVPAVRAAARGISRTLALPRT
ncbi:IclR family transcriptional regulator [Rhodococcus aerolatus]